MSEVLFAIGDLMSTAAVGLKVLLAILAGLVGMILGSLSWDAFAAEQRVRAVIYWILSAAMGLGLAALILN